MARLITITNLSLPSASSIQARTEATLRPLWLSLYRRFSSKVRTFIFRVVRNDNSSFFGGRLIFPKYSAPIIHCGLSGLNKTYLSSYQRSSCRISMKVFMTPNDAEAVSTIFLKVFFFFFFGEFFFFFGEGFTTTALVRTVSRGNSSGAPRCPLGQFNFVNIIKIFKY